MAVEAGIQLMEGGEGGRPGPALRYADTPYKRWQQGEGIAVHTGAYVEDPEPGECAKLPATDGGGPWPLGGSRCSR